LARGAELPINPEVLRWARESVGMEVAQVADRLGKPAEKYAERYAAWERGAAQPSVSYLEKLAATFKLPIAAFFLPSPPKEPPLPTDYRRRAGAAAGKLGVEAIHAIRRLRSIQGFLYECTEAGLLKRSAAWSVLQKQEALPPKEARTLLGLEFESQRQWTGHYHAFRELRALLESAGVFTIQASLPKGGFAGLSLFDPHVPMILLNRSESTKARVFTMAHELAHLLRGGDSICEPELEPPPRARTRDPERVEQECNQFAAEFLVPTDCFEAELDAAGVPVYEADGTVGDALLAALHNVFSVSKHVILLRLLEQSHINRGDYQQTIESWKTRPEERPAGGRGERTHVRAVHEVGRGIIAIALEAQQAGLITTADVVQMLRVQVGQLDDLMGEVASG